MEWYVYPIAILGGLAAGFINTVAGNGSAITLPLLIWLGLPPSVANGTNRVGVLFQSAVGTTQFHRKGVMDWRSGVSRRRTGTRALRSRSWAALMASAASAGVSSPFAFVSAW